MSLGAVLAATCLVGAVLLSTRGPLALDRPGATAASASTAVDVGWLARHRLLWSFLAGLGALLFLGGVAGLIGAPVAAVGVGVVATRAEPPEHRRRRAAERAELPHVVTLLAAALRAGAAPVDAVAVVVAALPGAAADRLAPVVARLRLGGDPERAWAELATDAGLGPLGRAMTRAHRTGAPVVGVLDRLSVELAATERADVEDRARSVGVKAAVPLGLCLLPSFLLIGIVPLVAGLLRSLAW